MADLRFEIATLHRRRKWGRRGRARGPNILSCCRFGAAVFLYASCLFYNPDIEILLARRCFKTLLSLIIGIAVSSKNYH